MGAAHVYQIFYDESSRRALDPGFLPLDNTANLRPDWAELWVIRQYLLANTLNEGDWYGFLSPKFSLKTGLDSGTVSEFLRLSDGQGVVALIPVVWDQLAYFQNPFEQGELWHPGITTVCQTIADTLGLRIDVRNTVACSSNFTFCNYLIAKPAYWRRWLTLANDLFSLGETGAAVAHSPLTAQTPYGRHDTRRPMKLFVQERLPLLLILQHGFRTTTLDVSDSCPVFNPRLRGLLQACDQLKRSYLETGEPRFLDAYRAVRDLIPTPAPPLGATESEGAAVSVGTNPGWPRAPGPAGAAHS